MSAGYKPPTTARLARVPALPHAVLEPGGQPGGCFEPAAAFRWARHIGLILVPDVSLSHLSRAAVKTLDADAIRAAILTPPCSVSCSKVVTTTGTAWLLSRAVIPRCRSCSCVSYSSLRSTPPPGGQV